MKVFFLFILIESLNIIKLFCGNDIFYEMIKNNGYSSKEILKKASEILDVDINVCIFYLCKVFQ